MIRNLVSGLLLSRQTICALLPQPTTNNLVPCYHLQLWGQTAAALPCHWTRRSPPSGPQAHYETRGRRESRAGSTSRLRRRPRGDSDFNAKAAKSGKSGRPKTWEGSVLPDFVRRPHKTRDHAPLSMGKRSQKRQCTAAVQKFRNQPSAVVGADGGRPSPTLDTAVPARPLSPLRNTRKTRK